MTLKHMASRTMRLAYDRDSDVLYIAFGLPQSGLDEEVEPVFFCDGMKPTAAFSAQRSWISSVVFPEVWKRCFLSPSRKLPLDRTPGVRWSPSGVLFL